MFPGACTASAAAGLDDADCSMSKVASLPLLLGLAAASLTTKDACSMSLSLA
jgi:hypothetical protein